MLARQWFHFGIPLTIIKDRENTQNVASSSRHIPFHHNDLFSANHFVAGAQGLQKMGLWCNACRKVPFDPVETINGYISCRQCYFDPQKDPSEDLKQRIAELQVSCPYTECIWVGWFGINGSLLQQHLAQCSYKPVKCNQCEVFIPQLNVEVHVNDECPMTLCVCKFERFGCTESTQLRRDLAKHYLEFSLQHESLLLQYIEYLETENANKVQQAQEHVDNQSLTPTSECDHSESESGTGFSDETKKKETTGVDFPFQLSPISVSTSHDSNQTPQSESIFSAIPYKRNRIKCEWYSFIGEQDEEMSNPLALYHPICVHVHPPFLFVSDESDRILVFDAQTEHYIRDLEVPSNIQLRNPSWITSSDRYLFISESRLNLVLLYSLETLKFVKSFGSTGKDNGKFQRPMGICCSPDFSKIFVCDSTNNRVQVFSHDTQEWLATWGSNYLSFPNGISIDSSTGLVYIANYQHDNIAVFQQDGTWVKTMGHNHNLKNPRSVYADQGRVYVTDSWNHRVQVVDAQTNKRLFSFGNSGAGKGQMRRPNSIQHLGRFVYVTEFENNRIQKFQLREQP